MNFLQIPRLIYNLSNILLRLILRRFDRSDGKLLWMSGLAADLRFDLLSVMLFSYNRQIIKFKIESLFKQLQL